MNSHWLAEWLLEHENLPMYISTNDTSDVLRAFSIDIMLNSIDAPAGYCLTGVEECE